MSKKAIAHLSKDQRMRSVIESIPLPPKITKGTLYESLTESIVSQQLSVKAAATIYSRFTALFPLGDLDPQQVLKMSIEELRSVGLSRQKAGYIQNVAAFFQNKDLLDHDWTPFSDQEIIDELTSIKGVGKWTVQMILMFTLNRPDVFPIDDLGIRNAMIKLYELEVTNPKDRQEKRALYQKLQEIAESWSPYRTLACRYLWNWLSV